MSESPLSASGRASPGASAADGLSPASPLRTSIIIVTCNQLPLTRQCLASLRRHTPQPYELIVVDNGSQDGTPEYLRGQPEVRLICNEENRGFPAAANQGLRAATAPLMLLLNNDVIVPAGWLERLRQPLLDHPYLGLVGPTTNNISGPQQIPIAYSTAAGMDAFAADLAMHYPGQLQMVERLVGFCLLMRREVMEKVGLLDERFGIGNFEDDDFCRRAVRAGFRLAIARDAYVHHVGSATFRGQGIDLDALLRRNRRLFEEKWGASDGNKRGEGKGGAAGGAVVARGAVAPLRPLPASPRVSLCMIVRDAERTLGACLQSVRPWVDEMIVVDTGSKDGTREVARSLGAKVFEFAWCDSFAAARNESLRHAGVEGGEWIFWMDADDTIDAENGRRLRELTRTPTAALGFILQVKCPPGVADGPQATATVVDHVKVFRNHPAIRFTGRIHEQVLPSIRRLEAVLAEGKGLGASGGIAGGLPTARGSGAVQWTDIVVNHSGSDQSPAGRTRKQERDLRLLRLELAEDPDHSFTLFNLGMTLLDAGRADAALDALARSLQLASPGESHCRKIYALLVQAYGALGRNATALKTCEQGLGHFSEDRELRYRKGQLHLALGQLPEAEAALQSLLALAAGGAGGGTRYFSSFDRGILGVHAWQMLATVLDRQGRLGEAAEAWRKVLGFNRSNLSAWQSLIDALARGGHVAALEEIADGRMAKGDTLAGAGGSGGRGEMEVLAEAALIARCRGMCARTGDGRGGGAGGGAQAAIGELEKACLGGAPVEVLDELCRLLFMSDQLVAAKRWLTELAQRRPGDAAAHLNLAVVLLRYGDYAAAGDHARRSLELRPGHAGATEVLAKAVAGLQAAR